MHLGNRSGGCAPDTPETGDDVESVVVPRQGVHVSDPEVSVGVAVPGHGEEAWRRIDPRAPCAAQASQLHREARSAGDVEQPVACVDAQAVVHGEVLATVGRFAEGGKLHGPPAPALVDPAPTVVEPGGDRTILRHGRDLGRAGPGMTGSSERPRSTRPSPWPQCNSSTGTARESSGYLCRRVPRASWPSMRASGAPRQ